MVDGYGQKRCRRRFAVEIVLEKKKQRGGIAAARDGDKSATGGKIDGGKEVVGKAGYSAGAVLRPKRGQHEACARSCLIRALSAPETSGYRLLISPNVAQATSRWWRPMREMPSFSSMSGAFLAFG